MGEKNVIKHVEERLKGVLVLIAAALALGASAETFDASSYGAKGDGVTKDTAAIQRAIDAAEKAGGGTVELAAGTYLSGSLYLKDNVELRLGPGAVLKASPDKEDYNRWDICPQNSTNRFESSFGAHLILAIEKRGVGVRGPGRIDGNADVFTLDEKGEPYGQQVVPWRPSQLLYFVECEDVRVTDLEIVRSPYWTLFLHGCEQVGVRGVRIDVRRKPHTHNGDGIDIDSCRYVTVSDCRINASDDAITLRGSWKRLKRRRPCEFVTVSNCILSSPCCAIRVGVGDGQVRNCTFSNCVIENTRTGIELVSSWSNDSHGVDIEGLRFSNFRVSAAAFCRIRHQFATEAIVRDIEFSGISGTSELLSEIRANVPGRFTDIRFRDVRIDKGVAIENAEGVAFEGGTFARVSQTPEEKAKWEEDFKRLSRQLWHRQIRQ